ncbi:hypothetical protein [Martelella sp. AMO21009]
MICDIDGIRLIGLHRADAAGIVAGRYQEMRTGAAIIAFPQRQRRRVGISGTGKVIDVADWRRRVQTKSTEVRQCISQ